jgi:hypothetical protein
VSLRSNNTWFDFRRPSPYNDFIRELKPEILSSNRLAKTFWQELVDKNLGLIDSQVEQFFS